MSNRWTFREDIYLVQFFEAAGVRNCAHDLGKGPASVVKRVQKLKGTCAWHELKELLAADWKHRRNYHIALGQSAKVEGLDMAHPGAPDELGEEHGYFLPSARDLPAPRVSKQQERAI